MSKENIERKRQFYLHNKSEYSFDDITFNDLNLDDIFLKFDRTSSSLGEEVLYSMLRSPLLRSEDVLERIKQIDNLADNWELTLKQRQNLESLSKLKKISLFEYLYKLNELEDISFFSKFGALILFAVAICCFFINVPLGIILTAVVYIINSVRYFKLKGEIAPYLICFSYISKAVKIASKSDIIDSNENAVCQNTFSGAFLCGTLAGVTTHGGSGNPLDTLIAFLKLAFHFDIIAFYSILRKIKNNMDVLNKCLWKIGYKDALIALALVRKENSDNICIPKFVDESEIYIEDCFHPLLNRPVSNTVDVRKSVLLTGSNASGKSTFLRSVAVNVAFAQAFGLCFAKTYRAPVFRMISSMSVSDSIIKNESLYVAEVKALKRICDLIENSKEERVLIFADEVLRGTNTVERIASSTQILKYFGTKATCFAATHDIELTDYLAKIYDNYHFNEDITDGEIHFNYKLKKGKADSHNAILLLKMMGFPSALIKDAEDMVTSFDNK